MDEIMTLIETDFSSVFLSVFVILIGVKAIVSLFEWIINKFGLETKWIRKRREEHDLLIQTSQNLMAAQSEIKQFTENRVHDREQSFRIQKELIDAQSDLAKSIDVISNKLDEMQRQTDRRFIESEQKNNKRIRAELKDKISQSYSHYHAVGEINDMEFEALNDLIEEYESAGGKNSFVHTIVQSEMYTWKRKEIK